MGAFKLECDTQRPLRFFWHSDFQERAEVYRSNPQKTPSGKPRDPTPAGTAGAWPGATAHAAPATKFSSLFYLP